jgi:RHS repeat-associated protein
MRGYTASSSLSYRYGFNGKEKDNEIKGEGNQYDYGMRIYDPRAVRFLSVDPLQKKYPELTPYQYASNSPIDGIDLDGLEVFAINGRTGETASGPLYLPNYPASQGWIISNGQPPRSPTAPQYSAVKPVINSPHSEAPPLAIQQQKARANNSQRPATPAPVTPKISQYTPPATQQERDAQNARAQNLNAQNGLNADGSDAFLSRLASNKTLDNLNNNIITPLMVLDGAYGLGRGGASLLLKSRYTTIFRTIDEFEASQLSSGQPFAFGPNGSDMKQFWLNKNAYNSYIQAGDGFFANGYRLQAKVPKSLIGEGNILNTSTQVDAALFPPGTINSATINGQADLGKFNSAVKNIKITKE